MLQAPKLKGKMMFKMEDNYFDEDLINGVKRESIFRKAARSFINLFNPVAIWKKLEPTEAEKLFFTKGILPWDKKQETQVETQVETQDTVGYQVKELDLTDEHYAVAIAYMTIQKAKETSSKAALG